ncbi:transmembrane protein 185A-like [Paramacrobiotus metropolitanus]|uniref:transmembrane protein 185A-like n=1 Tax=Paramacrobiotus metropolitanus TaxID=2943436 RepID=UPI002445A5AC|nr:transmembrane protein 185A-like [Paramacrobiotus metropolitanus]
MELQRLFQDFNHSKFVVHFSLFVFVFLFAIRLDETVDWNWWIVFIPLWMWKFLVFLGAVIGSAVWLKNPQSRMDVDSIIQFRAMWLSVAVHCFLFLFELLACEQLAQPSHRWILVFLPLTFVSLLSFFVCVWSLKRERPFELEMFCAVNIVQFVFLALRLDEIVTWSWVIVFIPLWVLTAAIMVGMSYSVIFACLVVRSADLHAEQRMTAVRAAISSSIVVLPMLITEILLVYKLDSHADMSFLFCSVPLLCTLLMLMFMACGTRGGNKWFFGLRKGFCHSLLAACPCLREYGNIKIAPSVRVENPTEETVALRDSWELRYADTAKFAKFAQTRLPTVQFISIESPD